MHYPISRGSRCWFDQPGYQDSPQYRRLPAPLQTLADRLNGPGYACFDVPGAPAHMRRIQAEVADAQQTPAAADIQVYIDSHDRWLRLADLPEVLRADPTAAFRYVNLHRQLPAMQELVRHPAIVERVTALLEPGWQVLKSSIFIRGSQQKLHADLPYVPIPDPCRMVTVWLALEDIGPDNGPAYLYPGSHRQVPWFDFGDGNALMGRFGPGESEAQAYFAYLERELARLQLPRLPLHLRAGQAVVWHAAMVHGGRPINDWQRTRHSMVLACGHLDA